MAVGSGQENACQTAQETVAYTDTHDGQPVYRLYKRRFLGIIGIMILNAVGGMNWPWFGPIANDTAATFDISLDKVNWLGNIVAVTYIFFTPFIPILYKRLGLRNCFFIGVFLLILASWVRYSGTAKSLSPGSAYTLLLIGQLLASISQSIFQVLPPKYSELWFSFKGRTTATMLMSISNPVGGAIGQVLSPLITGTRNSILVLGIISTAATPFVFLINSRPPTPPSYSGSHQSPPSIVTLKAMFGLLPKPVLKADVINGQDHASSILPTHEEMAYMTVRERIDFAIVFMVFGVLVAATNSFALLSDQILEPYGYSDDTAGFMGGALLLSGIVAAIITSPIFDRYLTHHLGFAARVFAPIIALAWFSLIWAVRKDNAGALYAIFVIIGVCSVSILPVGLELGCELTRNAEVSSAILWWSGSLWGIIFVLVMSALRGSDSANPPRNMRRALIFNAVVILVIVAFVFVLRGQQRRRETDVAHMNDTTTPSSPDTLESPSSAVPLQPVGRLRQSLRPISARLRSLSSKENAEKIGIGIECHQGQLLR